MDLNLVLEHQDGVFRDEYVRSELKSRPHFSDVSCKNFKNVFFLINTYDGFASTEDLNKIA